MKNCPNSENSPNKAYLSFPDGPTFETEIRVRYSETDRMGVAHNKSYFEWFEIGRTEYCRARNLPYRAIEDRGYYLVVAEAFCRYRKPLRYDDVILVRVSLAEITPRKAVFLYELRRKDGDDLVAQGYTVHVVTNARGKVCSLPEDLLRQMATP